MKNLRNILIVGLVSTITVLCLAGCSPSIHNEDVIGIWKVNHDDQSAMEENGIYNFYRFNDGGELIIEGWVQGSSIQRTGTWEIQDNSVIINVPEGESISAESISATAPAIEDGEVTFENDTLTTSAVGNETITANKISEEDYTANIEASKAKGPKSIAVGETVSEADLYSFTVDSISYEDEIYPSDTSGYYTYYPDESGSSYLVAHITMKNEATDYILPGYAASATFSINGNNYKGSVEVDAGTLYGQSYRVEAKDTASIVVYASIPDEVINSGETKLTIQMPKSVDMFQTYSSYITDFYKYSLTI